METLSRFRAATPADLPLIQRLVREFYAKQGAVYGIPFDEESARATFTRVVLRGLCLVGKSSVAGAVLAQFPWNARMTIAYVPFWYFRSAREIHILEALMARCRAQGAHFINVASHPPEHRIGSWYGRLGMWQVEGQWFGKLR